MFTWRDIPGFVKSLLCGELVFLNVRLLSFYEGTVLGKKKKVLDLASID